MNALEAVHRFETFRRLLVRYGCGVQPLSTFRNANVALPGGRMTAEPDHYTFEDAPPAPLHIVFEDKTGTQCSIEELGEDAFLDLIRNESAKV